MIDLRILNVFLAVADCGSFTIAAERLGRTQSAVSQSIRQLEEDLGVVLIDRMNRPMALTPAGSILRDHAHRLLQDSEALVTTVQNYGHAKVREMRIGLVDSLAAAVGPTLMKVLLDYSVGLTVWSGLTITLTNAFLGRKLDMIIANDPLDDVHGLERYELMRESYLLLAPSSIAIEPTNERLAILARDYPMIRYRPQSFLAGQLDRQLQQRNIFPRPRVSVDTNASLIAMVSAGFGWTSTTPLCVLQGRSYMSNLNVVQFPEPRFFRRLILLSRAGEFGELPKRLARAASEILKSHVYPEIRELLPSFENAMAVHSNDAP